jgi:hypothetical protein
MTSDTTQDEHHPAREDGLEALPMAITPSGVDPEQLMLAEVDTSPAPQMTIAEVALLLGRTTYWIRWQEPRESSPIRLEPGAHYVLSKDRRLHGPFGSPEEGVEHRLAMQKPGAKPIAGDLPIVGDGQWRVLEAPGKLRQGSYATEAEAREELGQQPIGGRTEQGARVYTLSQLEELIHYLAAAGKLTGQHAAYALSVVHSLALVYGYLKPTAESVVVQPGDAGE